MSESFATPQIVPGQAPLSVGFSRQECCSEWPFPPLGDLPDPGIERGSPALPGRFVAAEPAGQRYIGPGVGLGV